MINNGWQAGNSRMDEEGYAKGDQDDADAVRRPCGGRRQRPSARRVLDRQEQRASLTRRRAGLGKTIRDRSRDCLLHEWPLLVVCPSSARFHWEHEFRTWLPDEDYIPAGESGVLVVTAGHGGVLGEAMIVIVSYDLAHRDRCATLCIRCVRMWSYVMKALPEERQSATDPEIVTFTDRLKGHPSGTPASAAERDLHAAQGH